MSDKATILVQLDTDPLPSVFDRVVAVDDSATTRWNQEQAVTRLRGAPGSQVSADTNLPTGVQVGVGVKTASVHKDFTIGNAKSTGNKFDLNRAGFADIQNSQHMIRLRQQFQAGLQPETEGHQLLAGSPRRLAEVWHFA